MTKTDMDTAFSFIDKHRNRQKIRIALYAGEPLVHYDIVRYAITKARKRYADNVEFSVSINGMLFNSERIDWFVEKVNSSAS